MFESEGAPAARDKGEAENVSLMPVAKATAEVGIAVARDEMPRLLKSLAECGCLHPSRGSSAPGATVLRHLLGEVDALEQRLREMIAAAERAAGPAGGEAGVEVVRIGRRVEESLARLVESLEEALKDVEKLVERLLQLQNPESELSQLLAVLEAYSFIDVDVEALKRGRWLRAKVYRVPRDRVQGFIEALSRIEGVVAAHATGVEEGYDTVVAAYPAWLEAEVGKAALRSRATPLEIPEDLPRSPAEAFRRIRSELENMPQLLRQHLPTLRRALKLVEAAKRLLELLSATEASRLLAVIRGYVAPEELARLERAARESAASAVLIVGEYRPGGEGHGGHGGERRPPSYYEVPEAAKPLEQIVRMGGHPRPYELVPLALLAISVPVIYGLVFPDLGHGLVLVLAGYYLFYKKLGNQLMGRLVMLFGAAAMVSGFLSGEFFGPHPVVAGWLAKGVWGGHPPLASPLHPFVELLEKGANVSREMLAEHATRLLYHAMYISLAVGSFFLALSSWLSLANGLLQRDRELTAAGLGKALLFTAIMIAIVVGGVVGTGGTAMERAGSVLKDAGLTLVPETGLGMLVRLMATIGILTLLAAPLLYGHGGFSERLVAGIMEAFDALLMAIGNTASFMRIMGLALAHSGLMMGFTVMAYIAGPAPVAALVYILGNILVIALEAIVAYAHTLRLHLYEMFSKFYLDQGTPYTPVKLPEGVKLELEEQ